MYTDIPTCNIYRYALRYNYSYQTSENYQCKWGNKLCYTIITLSDITIIGTHTHLLIKVIIYLPTLLILTIMVLRKLDLKIYGSK